jgi:hypothetical protein
LPPATFAAIPGTTTTRGIFTIGRAASRSFPTSPDFSTTSLAFKPRNIGLGNLQYTHTLVKGTCRSNRAKTSATPRNSLGSSSTNTRTSPAGTSSSSANAAKHDPAIRTCNSGRPASAARNDESITPAPQHHTTQGIAKGILAPPPDVCCSSLHDMAAVYQQPQSAYFRAKTTPLGSAAVLLFAFPNRLLIHLDTLGCGTFPRQPPQLKLAMLAQRLR